MLFCVFMPEEVRRVRLGLRENLGQFSLLVLINAFVGAMVGLERTILPLLAEQEFGLTSRTTILSFIVSFGITKALTNFSPEFYPTDTGAKACCCSDGSSAYRFRFWSCLRHPGTGSCLQTFCWESIRDCAGPQQS